MNTPLPDFITDASGRFGDRVFLTGTKMRSRRYVVPRDPRTPKQQQARARFAQAVQAWAALPEPQRWAWDTWAAAGARTGYGAFLSLAVKRLHVQPNADVRMPPPQAAFSSRLPTITATNAGAAEIVWEMSGPSMPGMVIELLVQPLRRAGSPPSPDKYRTAAFAAADTHQLARTPLAPGLWACAVRAVHPGTGQVSSLTLLPAVRVPS